MTRMHCLAAVTTEDDHYPGYVNIAQDEDGTVVVHVRGEPKQHWSSVGMVMLYTPGSETRLRISQATYQTFLRELKEREIPSGSS